MDNKEGENTEKIADKTHGILRYTTAMAGKSSTVSSNVLTNAPNSARKEIMLRMESNLTSRMDNIHTKLDTLTVTVKANENKIKDIEERLNAQVRYTQHLEQETIPNLKRRPKTGSTNLS